MEVRAMRQADLSGSLLFGVMVAQRVRPMYPGTAIPYMEAMEVAFGDPVATNRIWDAYRSEPHCRYCGRKNTLMGAELCASCGAPLP